MYKQTLIQILGFILAASLVIGCSTSRKVRNSASGAAGEVTTYYEYGDLLRTGVSSEGFFIKKLRIVIDIDGNRNSYTANLRKSDDGKWLASIQLLRVEVFRVFADRESVTILDRIGRKAIIITWEVLAMKYGITYDLLPAILGDIPRIARQAQKDIGCISPTEFRAGSFRYEIVADCNIPRAREMIITSTTFGRTLSVKAEEYSIAEERYYTSVIFVEERSGVMNFVLYVDDLTIPWNGEIDFSIPANYKIER